MRAHTHTHIHTYYHDVDMYNILFSLADGSLLKGTIIPTPSPPMNVALSCDDITLSVCLLENGILKCYFYDIRSLSVKVCTCTLCIMYNDYVYI